MTGIFLQLSRVLPDQYPLADDVPHYLADELGLPGLLDCISHGAMTYAWSYEDRHVWQPPKSLAIPLVRRALPARQ